MVSRKTLILISGWKESGKDTVYNFLQRKYGFIRVAFADLLKDQTATMYPVKRDELDSTAWKAKPMLDYPVIAKDDFSDAVQRLIYNHFATAEGLSPQANKDPELHLGRIDQVLCWDGQPLFWTRRAILVMDGSTKRTFNPNYWIDAPLLGAKVHPLIAVTDARYENEITRAVKLLEGEYDIITFRVDTLKPPLSTDASERSLDNFSFDRRVVNEHDGIEKFYKLLEGVFDELLQDEQENKKQKNV
jgi:hypothetical protein